MQGKIGEKFIKFLNAAETDENFRSMNEEQLYRMLSTFNPLELRKTRNTRTEEAVFSKRQGMVFD
jgi:hypothetical protein